MPLPVDVTVENCSKTVASSGQVPIDGAVQWSDPGSPDWAIRDGQGGSLFSSVLDFYTPCVLNLGAGGNHAAYLGSMATQTTRRVHIVGVPLTPGQRLTGTLESGDLSPTAFAVSGDGLALFGGVYPSVDFGATNIAITRTQTRDFNPLCETVELDGRNSTYGVYHQWRCQLYPGKKRVKWTLTLTFNDERLSDRVLAWPRVRIKVPASWELHVEHPSRCPGNATYTSGNFKYFDVVPDHTIHDAQSARFRGTFMLPNPTATELGEWMAMPGNRYNVPRLLCDPEEFRGKLYFYSGLPAVPTSIDAASCRDRYDVFANFIDNQNFPVKDYTRLVGDNENRPRARDGGAQADFAAGPFYHAFFRSGGNPLILAEHDAAGCRHMARPITQRHRGLDEVDSKNARIVKWGDYPAADFYTQEQYFHTQALKSRFPTTDPRGKSTTGLNQWVRPYQGMTGMPRSHWSFLHAIEALFLGGCFDAEDIVRQHIEWFLHEWTTLDISHARAGQARFARAIDMACWSWLLTGDTRIVDRLNELATIGARVFPNYTADVAAGYDWIRIGGPLTTNQTTDLGSLGGVRTMQGTTVDPWQVRLCQGYYRAYQLTGNQFWLDLTKNVTRSWIKLWRFGRSRHLKSRGWQFIGPRWHQYFKIRFPDVGDDRRGAIPSEDYVSEDNEYITWQAFEDNNWVPHMLTLAMSLHTSEPEIYDKAFQIFMQEYVPWRDATSVRIFDDRGEWYGDDALIPDGSNLVFDFVDEAVASSELGFEVEVAGDVDVRFDPDVVQSDELEGFTLDVDLVFDDAPLEIVEHVESDFSVEIDNSVEITAEPAVIKHREIEPGGGDDDTGFEIEISLDVTFAEEAVEKVEPAFSALTDGDEEFIFPPEEVNVTEPEFVFDDGTQSPTNFLIRGEAGAPKVIEGEAGPPTVIRGTVG